MSVLLPCPLRPAMRLTPAANSTVIPLPAPPSPYDLMFFSLIEQMIMARLAEIRCRPACGRLALFPAANFRGSFRPVPALGGLAERLPSIRKTKRLPLVARRRGPTDCPGRPTDAARRVRAPRAKLFRHPWMRRARRLPGLFQWD